MSTEESEQRRQRRREEDETLGLIEEQLAHLVEATRKRIEGLTQANACLEATQANVRKVMDGDFVEMDIENVAHRRMNDLNAALQDRSVLRRAAQAERDSDLALRVQYGARADETWRDYGLTMSLLPPSGRQTSRRR